MPSKKHKPEEIIGKLREVEIMLGPGGTTAEACRRIAVSEQTYYRWRKEYGGLKTDQARRMKDLENAAVGVSPKGDYDVTFGYTLDNSARKTASISQGGGGGVLDGGHL